MEWKIYLADQHTKSNTLWPNKKKGTAVLNYMNTNVVYLKKQQKNTDSDVHNILSRPTSKIPNI